MTSQTSNSIVDSVSNTLFGYDSNISVQEIIDAANIGRSTFYAHFETKDELLRALCTEVFEHVFSDDLHKEDTHDFSSREKDIEAEVTHVLYHLNDSRPYLKSILLSESGEMFMKYFKEYLAELFAGELDQDSSGVPHDSMQNHMVCDFAETVRWWMKHEQYSAEELSGFFFAVSPLKIQK